MENPFKKLSKEQLTFLFIFVITIIAAILRFNFYFHIKNRFILNGDANNYHFMARQIAHDHIYGYAIGEKSITPNAIVPPVFPLMFSFVCALVKGYANQINAMRLIQVFLGTFTPALAYLSINAIFRRRKIALLTALLVAIYPPYYESPYRVLTEVTSLFTMLLYFYLSAISFSKQKIYLYILSGVAFALQILTRPAMLPLVILPFIYGYFVPFKRDVKLLGKAFLFTVSGFIIVILPWWIRNIATLHRFVLTSDGSANPLLAGTYPDLKGMAKDISLHDANDIDQKKYAIKRITKGFSNNFITYFKWYTIGKLKLMFSDPWMVEEVKKIQLYNYLIHYFIVFGAIGGSIYGIIKNALVRFIALYCLAFIGIYLIFIPTTRYSYQIMFIFMAITSYLVITLYDFTKTKIHEKTKKSDPQTV